MLTTSAAGRNPLYIKILLFDQLVYVWYTMRRISIANLIAIANRAVWEYSTVPSRTLPDFTQLDAVNGAGPARHYRDNITSSRGYRVRL